MDHLSRFLDLVLSLPGMLAVSLGLAAVAFGVRHRQVLPHFLVLPIFVSCFGKYRFITQSYAFPLEQILDVSRPLFVVGLLLVVPMCLILLPQRSSRAPHPASLWLFLFQLVYAHRVITEGSEGFGYLAFAVFALALAAVYLLRGAMPPEKEVAARMFCTAFALAGALFALACTYQYFVNPAAAHWAGRFIGVSSNSIHTGEFCGWFLLSTIAVLSAIIRRRRYWLMWILGGICVLHALIIVSTGSRTAVVLFVSGLVVMFRNRLGKFLVPAMMIPIGLGVLDRMTSDFAGAADHLVSGTDSRTALFRSLWQRFLDDPLYGRAIFFEDTGKMVVRESSYLTAAASLGVLGAVPLLLCAATGLRSLQKAMKRDRVFRSRLGLRAESMVFSDWAMALVFSSFIGAFFEGFFFAIVGPAVLLLHVGFSLVNSPVVVSHKNSRLTSQS